MALISGVEIFPDGVRLENWWEWAFVIIMAVSAFFGCAYVTWRLSVTVRKRWQVRERIIYIHLHTLWLFVNLDELEKVADIRYSKIACTIRPHQKLQRYLQRFLAGSRT